MILQTYMLGEGYSNLVRLMAGSTAIKQRHASSPTSKQFVGQVFSHESPAYALTRLAVTETTNMGESNGTNLKPIATILFFLQVFENCGVPVLRLDSWCERLRSTSTPCGAKVLILFFHTVPFAVIVIRQVWNMPVIIM